MTAITATPAGREIGIRTLLVLAMAMPMLLLYAVSALGPQLVHDLAISPESLGYFTVGSFGMATVLSLRVGALVSRIGGRYGLAMLFGSVALTFALMASLPGFYSLLLTTALLGMAQALANPVTNLLIDQRVAPQHKAFVVGLKQSGVQLAALFAGAVLPTCALQLGWRGTFALVVPLALALSLWALRQTGQPAAKDVARATATTLNPRLGSLMAVQCCVGIALSAFITYLPLYAVSLGMDQAEAGFLVALFGAMGIVSRLVITPLGARLREDAFLLAGLLLVSGMSIALILQADAASSALLWLAATGVGLTAVATNAIAMSMLIRDAAFGNVASTSGMVSAAFFAGFTIGPASIGELARRSGSLGSAWEVLLVVLALGIVSSLFLAQLRRRGDTSAAE
ncbi:MFS transporter [Verminephrobacter aporrectodeae subsp. tuberculatae]|uniref:MFS transporter n=1 Tax=Verminephrobacter aporrectodeae subsp. tuberculatae TaxID=1110392 RepID=A0ABT3KXJ7_9BURK|nr:MFS transporter [Verminephrobacter aporrectodeae]MCW5323061.1 MFS transporter [Verminephrobacter aporrectodeae subsp. tuberculatae]MCW8198196.1 MFS transporter [Verminephrobacter aporrectodeae subsp. tuberculatae]